MAMSDQLVTTLQAQKRRVLAALMEHGTVDATPILRGDEHLRGGEYTTLVYELHLVLLPELESEGFIQFDRFEDEISRGECFDGELPELEANSRGDSSDDNRCTAMGPLKDIIKTQPVIPAERQSE